MSSTKKRKPATRHRRKDSQNDLLAFHMKRFEKEKKRLEAQFERQLAEEKQRFEKMRRDLEKERKRFRKERANISDTHKKVRKEALNLKNKRRSMQANSAKEKRMEASEERMSKAKYIALLRQIRTEKAELLTLRDRIKQERKILKEERKALDRDRNLVKEQRGGVLEAFAQGYKPSRKKARTPKTGSPHGKLDIAEDQKVFSPDSESDEEIIDQAYSFFTEEERNKRKSDRQRLISESWSSVKGEASTVDKFSKLAGSRSERIQKAIRSNGLIPAFWDILDHICGHLDRLENLIPQLRDFALQCFNSGLFSDDYNILGECLVTILSTNFAPWEETHNDSWAWCLDLVMSTLVTSHELELAKQEAGDSFNVEDFELGSEFSVDLDNLSDFEFSIDLDDEELLATDDSDVLDNL